MVTIRRWYIYLVCAVSVQAVTWAAITLLRDLLAGGEGASIAATAFQIAVILIGLPLFLLHWLWAQRRASTDAEEQESGVRRLYLFSMLAAFLIPALVNAHDLITRLLLLALGAEPGGFDRFSGFSTTELVVRNGVALVVLALLLAYHGRVATAEEAQASRGDAAAVRRLFLLLFSAAGLFLTAEAATGLLRWLLFQAGGEASGGLEEQARQIALLVTGLPLWLLCWRGAQRLFRGTVEEERESVLRKVYLYLIVFIAAFATVSNGALILAGLFRWLLGLPTSGDLRDPLPGLLVMGLVWLYHAAVLREDAASAGEAPRQASVRRVYLYLVAAIGLATFLTGLAGEISVLIRALTERAAGDDLREQLAWVSAALVVGLPIWLLPWRRVQAAAAEAGEVGAGERRSVARRFYLYLYLFLATMTILSSLIFIVSRVLRLLLGEPGSGNLISDLAHALAFTLIGAGVWLYHGWAMRGDDAQNRAALAERLGETRIAVVDGGDGAFGLALLDALRRDLPGLRLDAIGLTPAAAAAMGAPAEGAVLTEQLEGTSLIVGPWTMLLADGAAPAGAMGALARSPARKLLIPRHAAGWEWSGVEQASDAALVEETVRAVKQLAEGKEIESKRPLGAGAVVAIILAALFLLPLLLGLVAFLLNF